MKFEKILINNIEFDQKAIFHVGLLLFKKKIPPPLRNFWIKNFRKNIFEYFQPCTLGI